MLILSQFIVLENLVYWRVHFTGRACPIGAKKYWSVETKSAFYNNTQTIFSSKIVVAEMTIVLTS